MEPLEQTAAQRLEESGYMQAADVAERTGHHIGSIYRWCALDLVESTKLGNVRWIKIQSLIDKLGVDTATALGIVLPEPVKKKKA
jgi:hypothetical protein